MISGKFVADVLKQVEVRYPLVGTALLDTLFPGSLRVKDPEDIAFWRAALDARKNANKHGTRPDCLAPLEQGVNLA
ncbi:hypothetical protein B0O99DRAFT_643276 [Bisporella sp. PMI_857]|nr:hypothetical protein B0O99DRAFT_643276 [Bisporella sp. PMI_857]